MILKEKSRMMLEFITLGLFLLGLTVCILGEFEILYALVFGWICFNLYSLKRGYSLHAVFKMMMEGIVKVRIVLTIFALIGLLTASWRASGTISYIIYHGINFIEPQFFVLCTFLLCCGVSFLIGTSFGTVSTVGVICMMLSNSAGLDPLLTGGAILSGIFFGDRGSPMSSSAQLVSAITQTDIYNNVKGMMKTGIVPFAATCVFYVLFASGNSAEMIDTSAVNILSSAFNLHWITVFPAVLILTLAIFRIDVRIAMGSSILFCCVLALLLQNTAIIDLLNYLVFGYQVTDNKELAELLNGGGLLSMLRPALIVMISSSYSGVFLHTPILSSIKSIIEKTAGILKSFGAATVTSIFAGAVSCNQTLAVILTEQLCHDLYRDKRKYALVLENTAILIPVLIPWNIAGSVPIATIGVPAECLFYAVFLYFTPLWNWGMSLWEKDGHSE